MVERRTTTLAHFSAARAALAKATKIDEVKQIRDKAEALRTYAKQAGESLEMQNQCAEIKLRAERKAGGILAEADKAKGGRPPKTPSTMEGVSLADIGIDYHESHRWQRIASIPEGVFERHIEEVKAARDELTTVGMLRVADGKPHVAHNAGQNEWRTPPEYVKAVRAVMGGIDCDPASSEAANKIVGAARFFTAEQDGLKHMWGKRTYMNPPYSQPLVANFCDSLVTRLESGEIETAIVLVNNATETTWFHRLLDAAAALCLVRGRVRFLDPRGDPGAPLQGQAILYFGPRVNAFFKGFRQFGAMCRVMPERMEFEP
jgi:phage N-6-adenine-methyltransferase